jgi:predicted permease
MTGLQKIKVVVVIIIIIIIIIIITIIITINNNNLHKTKNKQTNKNPQLWSSVMAFLIHLLLGEQVPLAPVDLCGYFRG